jgi:hypothetical protein
VLKVDKSKVKTLLFTIKRGIVSYRTFTTKKEVKMAKKKTVCTWYLEPIGAVSNMMIGGCCDSEDFINGITCADGKKHKLWRCTEEVRDAMVISRNLGLPLSFKVFCRKGEEKIEDVSTEWLSKKKKKI